MAILHKIGILLSLWAVAACKPDKTQLDSSPNQDAADVSSDIEYDLVLEKVDSKRKTETRKIPVKLPPPHKQALVIYASEKLPPEATSNIYFELAYPRHLMLLHLFTGVQYSAGSYPFIVLDGTKDLLIVREPYALTDVKNQIDKNRIAFSGTLRINSSGYIDYLTTKDSLVAGQESWHDLNSLLGIEDGANLTGGFNLLGGDWIASIFKRFHRPGRSEQMTARIDEGAVWRELQLTKDPARYVDLNQKPTPMTMKPEIDRNIPNHGRIIAKEEIKRPGAYGQVYFLKVVRSDKSIENLALKVSNGKGDFLSEYTFMSRFKGDSDFVQGEYVKVQTSGVFREGLLMEQVGDRNLAQHLEKKPLSPIELQRYYEFRDRVREKLGEKNVIHGDIKLDNIFVSGEGDQIKFILGDFGSSMDASTALIASVNNRGTAGYLPASVMYQGWFKVNLGPEAHHFIPALAEEFAWAVASAMVVTRRNLATEVLAGRRIPEIEKDPILKAMMAKKAQDRLFYMHICNCHVKSTGKVNKQGEMLFQVLQRGREGEKDTLSTIEYVIRPPDAPKGFGSVEDVLRYNHSIGAGGA